MTEKETIQALKQINLKRVHPFYSWEEMAEVRNIAIQALEEIQQYRAIGTAEECRAAVEKMKPKKPIWKPIYEYDKDYGWWHCPNCNDVLTDRIPADNATFYFHCLNCGQTFDWE